jgi:hypothetical protein
MGFADYYLGRQKGFTSRITDPPSAKLGFVIVIPAFCEPGITDALQSLWNCQRPERYTEVLVVVNSSRQASEEIIESNASSIRSASEWILQHQDPAIQFYILHVPDMPVKDAGVGLARKTGMDEALNRFNLISNPSGYILSFDADSICDPNYLTALEHVLDADREIKGFDVYFEHPVQGDEFPEHIYKGIVGYELHLRYLNQFLRFIGFPFAHHTIGSCFGVRADMYAAQGGMNKRKAGEDFYFLHKIIPLGHFTDINNTRVIPSPRESFRVPFGTGAAIGKFSESREILTYVPECFLVLKELFDKVSSLYKIDSGGMDAFIHSFPEPLKNFLLLNKASVAMTEINANSGSLNSFTKRFFRWFDAFRIIKFLNYSARDYYPQIPVRLAANRLLEILDSQRHAEDEKILLQIFRTLERKGSLT